MRISDWSSDVCSSDLHVDERLVDPFRLRAPGDTEEAGRGKIERQLLDRRIEWKGRSAPLRDTRANAVVERGGIVAHRFGLESDRQRLAVGAMFFELHQHPPIGRASWRERVGQYV